MLVVKTRQEFLSLFIGVAVIAIASWGPGNSFAADFLGAENIISEVTAAEEKGKAKSTAGSATMETLTVEANKLFKELPAMAPEKAARDWMELLKQWWELQDSDPRIGYGGNSTLSQKRIFQNLPGPETWPELHRLAQSTTSSKPARALVLETITAKLTDDQEATSHAVTKLKGALESRHGSGASDIYEKLEQELFDADESPQSVIQRFEKLLRQRRESSGYSEPVTVPDLIALSDVETARRLLTNALLLPNIRLEFSGNNQTLQLAKQVALDNLQQMPEPRWDLAHSLDSLELFNALSAKFINGAPASNGEETTSPEKSFAKVFGFGASVHEDSESNDPSKKEALIKAKVYHYLDLVAINQLSEAESIFSFDSEFLSALDRVTGEVLADLPISTVHEELGKKLDGATTAPSELWKLTQDLSRLRNALNEHTAKLEKAVADVPSDDKSVPSLYRLLANAYLELNEPQKAVDYLQKIGELPLEGGSSGSERASAAALLVQLGNALSRPEWVTLGIEQLTTLQRQILADPKKDAMGFYAVSSVNEKLVTALLEEGRGAEAEKAVLDMLKGSAQQRKGRAYADHYVKQILQSLVIIYHQADRSSDIMTLLTEAPWWGVDDVGEVESAYFANTPKAKGELAVGFAGALASAGHMQEAVTLLKNSIIKSPSADAAYDALTSMTGSAIIPWLDELAARDPFEERPLVWKAIVLHRSGDLDKAEEAARAALKVDPTDGEQPKGARLLSYAVLADILGANKKTSESETLKQVVAAVRLAERGDELNEIGLVDQAVQTYVAASRDFSDAYCVEWRLARRLQERGEEEAATEHYTKAFTLMPNQFGQMAHLCFGCENIFATAKPQSIAERVLQGMVEKPPVKATVYHLLGQLREAQGKHVEAADYFRKATEVDPDYFDAWKYLYDISEKAFVSPEERGKIASRLMELDPYLQHFTLDANIEVPAEILWTAGERKRKWMQDLEKPVFTLTASKARLEELRSATKADQSYPGMGYTGGMHYEIGDRRLWPGPAEHLVSQAWFQQLLQISSYGM